MRACRDGERAPEAQRQREVPAPGGVICHHCGRVLRVALSCVRWHSSSRVSRVVSPIMSRSLLRRRFSCEFRCTLLIATLLQLILFHVISFLSAPPTTQAFRIILHFRRSILRERYQHRPSPCDDRRGVEFEVVTFAAPEESTRGGNVPIHLVGDPLGALHIGCQFE